MKPETRLNITRLLALAAVIGISIYIFSLGERAAELEKYGYPGIFLLSILANATVLLPAPGIIFVFAMGSVFNPFWVGIAAGAGASLGELSGYLAGFSGQAVVERTETYQKLVIWMSAHRKLTFLLISVLAFIPNPFFDLAGFAAGTLKIPLAQFLFCCWIGKTLKMLGFAYAGALSIDWVKQLMG
jgi:uncharacterized membrane protein YdjX (TVP38/TMEM64 family)